MSVSGLKLENPSNSEILVKILYRLLKNRTVSARTFYFEPPCMSQSETKKHSTLDHRRTWQQLVNDKSCSSFFMVAIRIRSWILDHFPGFFAISRYGVNWHFAAFLQKWWTDFDEIFEGVEMHGSMINRLHFWAYLSRAHYYKSYIVNSMKACTAKSTENLTLTLYPNSNPKMWIKM